MSHTGIRLRVAIPQGVILEGDSDWLHLNALYVGGAVPEISMEQVMNPAAAPPEYAWHDILRTTGGMVISVKPCILADAYPDDEDQDDAPEQLQVYPLVNRRRLLLERLAVAYRDAWRDRPADELAMRIRIALHAGPQPLAQLSGVLDRAGL